MASREGRDLLTRRAALKSVGFGLFAAVVTACGGAPRTQTNGEGKAPVDFSGRFVGFQVAPEPNGDLSKVVWPDYVTRAGPEVKRLYEFQIENGDVMKYMPCFCGCGGDGAHRNNRDCYVKQVDPDGSVIFDSMAPT